LVNAVHTLPVSEKFSLVSSLTFRAEDGGFTGAENDFQLDNFETFGARIALESDRWSFAVAGQNLTDQRYLINQSPNNLRVAEARRIFGFVTFRW
jgi:outer membrane receptor protein involved in Fe transport